MTRPVLSLRANVIAGESGASQECSESANDNFRPGIAAPYRGYGNSSNFQL